jgi:hypothetical protein
VSKRLLERWRHKPLLQELWWCIALFAAVAAAVGFLGGDRGPVPFAVGFMIAALAAIPLLVLTAFLFLTADRDNRRDYILRIAFILLLAAAMTAWNYAS